MKYAAVFAFAASLIVAAPAGAWAADALHPYSNIDHRVDAGNNTGNAMVPQLNEQQLRLNGIGAVAAVRADTGSNTPAANPVSGY